MAEATGNTLLLLIQERFKNDDSPAGVPWAARQGTDDGHKLLEKSGKLRRGFQARVSGDSVIISNTQPYEQYVQHTRAIVPNGSLPSEWRDRIDAAVAAAITLEMSK